MCNKNSNVFEEKIVYHIVINENGRFEKSFQWKKVPEFGDLFRYEKDGEQTKIYTVTKVDLPPLGLRGRVSYQVSLELQTRRRGDQTLVPLIKIEYLD